MRPISCQQNISAAIAAGMTTFHQHGMRPALTQRLTLHQHAIMIRRVVGLQKLRRLG